MLSEGLTDWMYGVDSLEAETAAELVAETVIMFRAWLESKTTKR